MQAKEAQLTDFEVNHVNCYLPKNSHLGAKNVITLVQLRERDKVYKAQTGPIFLDPFVDHMGPNWVQSQC